MSDDEATLNDDQVRELNTAFFEALALPADSPGHRLVADCANDFTRMRMLESGLIRSLFPPIPIDGEPQLVTTPSSFPNPLFGYWDTSLGEPYKPRRSVWQRPNRRIIIR
jgi:hypothetical protein